MKQVPLEILKVLGWNIIPLRPGSKCPMFPWAPYRNSHYMGPYPEGCNYGAILGQLTGYVVLDSDTPEAEIWAKENLPETGIVCQTNKGFHRYYTWPGYPVNNSKLVCPFGGMDLKADNGYVLIPPSEIPSTKTKYQWISFQPDKVPVFNLKWLNYSHSTGISDPGVYERIGIRQIDEILKALFTNSAILSISKNRFSIYVKYTFEALKQLGYNPDETKAGPRASDSPHVNGFVVLNQTGLSFISNAGGIFCQIKLKPMDQMKLAYRMSQQRS